MSHSWRHPSKHDVMFGIYVFKPDPLYYSHFVSSSHLEAVENIKTVLDNLLRVQGRMDTLREKLTALNTSESQQSLE